MKRKIPQSKQILSFVFVFFLLLQTAGFAFVYQLVIPDRSAIAKFSNEQLIKALVDVQVELEAANIFHQTSGFRPQDYESHKALIRYRIELLIEMQKRKLEIPKVVP